MMRFSFILLLSLIACGQEKNYKDSSPQTPSGIAINKDASAKTELGVTSELSMDQIKISVETSKQNKSVKFINQSSASVWYQGYGSDSAIYDVQSKKISQDGEANWNSLYGYCGNGLEAQELKSGDQLIYSFEGVEFNKDVKFIRVSLNFQGSAEAHDFVKAVSKEISLP